MACKNKPVLIRENWHDPPMAWHLLFSSIIAVQFEVPRNSLDPINLETLVNSRKLKIGMGRFLNSQFALDMLCERQVFLANKPNSHNVPRHELREQCMGKVEPSKMIWLYSTSLLGDITKHSLVACLRPGFKRNNSLGWFAHSHSSGVMIHSSQFSRFP